MNKEWIDGWNNLLLEVEALAHSMSRGRPSYKTEVAIVREIASKLKTFAENAEKIAKELEEDYEEEGE